MGRPTTLTRRVEQEILSHIGKGAHPVQAARAAGVAESTLRGWLTNPKPVFAAFRVAIEQAEAEAELQAVDEVRRIDPRWWLDRRHPERWGKAANGYAQAATFVAVSAGGHDSAAPNRDERVVFTRDGIRAAAELFIDRRRAEHGETPELGSVDALAGLYEEVLPDGTVLSTIARPEPGRENDY